MIGAPATGLRGSSSDGSPRSRAIEVMLENAYWAPRLPKLPVSSQISFST